MTGVLLACGFNGGDYPPYNNSIIIIADIILIASCYVLVLKVTNMTGLITFTKAKVNNKGEYTCTAINEVGNTTLTYNTYIGGILIV